MDKAKGYIQDADWFKVGRDKAIKALDKEYHDSMDDAILEAIDDNSLSSKDLKGRGAGLKKDLTPKGAGLA